MFTWLGGGDATASGVSEASVASPGHNSTESSSEVPAAANEGRDFAFWSYLGFAQSSVPLSEKDKIPAGRVIAQTPKLEEYDVKPKKSKNPKEKKESQKESSRGKVKSTPISQHERLEEPESPVETPNISYTAKVPVSPTQTFQQPSYSPPTRSTPSPQPVLRPDSSETFSPNFAVASSASSSIYASQPEVVINVPSAAPAIPDPKPASEVLTVKKEEPAAPAHWIANVLGFSSTPVIEEDPKPSQRGSNTLEEVPAPAEKNEDDYVAKYLDLLSKKGGLIPTSPGDQAPYFRALSRGEELKSSKELLSSTQLNGKNSKEGILKKRRSLISLDSRSSISSGSSNFFRNLREAQLQHAYDWRRSSVEPSLRYSSFLSRSSGDDLGIIQKFCSTSTSKSWSSSYSSVLEEEFERNYYYTVEHPKLIQSGSKIGSGGKSGGSDSGVQEPLHIFFANEPVQSYPKIAKLQAEVAFLKERFDAVVASKLNSTEKEYIKACETVVGDTLKLENFLVKALRIGCGVQLLENIRKEFYRKALRRISKNYFSLRPSGNEKDKAVLNLKESLYISAWTRKKAALMILSNYSKRKIIKYSFNLLKGVSQARSTRKYGYFAHQMMIQRDEVPMIRQEMILGRFVYILEELVYQEKKLTFERLLQFCILNKLLRHCIT